MTDAALLLDRLERGHRLSQSEYAALITARSPALAEDAFRRARRVRERVYGRDVYLRGLIEFTSYCKNDCYYCGLRRSNRLAGRYRLDEAQILACCEAGYALGLRTFVLQGGEDGAYSPERLAAIVRSVKARYPGTAVTLSFGEHPAEAYRLWREAGADRYLLRHETANPDHYRRLHPPELSPERRKSCLWELRRLGYQVGAGFLVGSPGQTPELLAEDFLFLSQLQPHMVGIGPFIPHRDTPLGGCPPGDVEQTLYLLALLRLTLPGALLPATTALATLDEHGYERGMLAGANVVMPNLTPPGAREQYLLYDHKQTGDEAAGKLDDLNRRMASIGYALAYGRGDSRAGTPAEKES